MVLSREEIEQFIELGWVRLEGAFGAREAAATRAVLWRRMGELGGVRQDDPSTWPDFFNLEEHLWEPEIIASFSERLCAAIAQLVGPDRWSGRRKWGLWPINFSFGKERPWEVPDYGWHIDGNYFRHTLDTPKQGLLLCGLFSDIGPRGGGTAMAQGSHKMTARVLARHPRGMTHRELFDEVLKDPIGDVVEGTGAAGDVLIMHPWLFHTRSQNHSSTIRFMSNTEAALRKPLRFDRDEGEHSILELSIKRALAEAPRTPSNPFRARF